MSMYYCRFCGEAPSWNPLTDGECDSCWEKRVQKLEAEGLTRSDAQGVVMAENSKWNKEQEAIHQGELEAEIRQGVDKTNCGVCGRKLTDDYYCDNCCEFRLPDNLKG